jgi:hypothetical protein
VQRGSPGSHQVGSLQSTASAEDIYSESGWLASADGRYLVHLPRLLPHLGQVAGRQECGAASNGEEPVRPRAGSGYSLVSVHSSR